MFKKILAGMLCIGLSTPVLADDHAVDMFEETSMEWTKRKGLRFGYNFANMADESERLDSPHMFALGFELQQTMSGDSWLDILFIQNLTVSGLEQSVLVPSANALVGFEIQDQLQLAVGANITVYDPSGEDHFFHLVTAVGWTQDAGIFSVPVHFIFVPDVNNYYRLALTTGVNW